MESAILRKWRVIDCFSCRRLEGEVSGHPNFPDGTLVTTSRLVELDEAARLATTLNTIYVLRDPAKEAS